MTYSSEFDISLFLPDLLNQAAEASAQRFQKLYKTRYGLLPTDWNVLCHLGRHGRLAAQDVSVRAGLHKTKVSRAVQRLESRGLVCRSEDEVDRRRAPIELTAQGQEAYSELQQAARDHEAGLVNGLSDEDIAALRRTLMHLEQAARRDVRT